MGTASSEPGPTLEEIPPDECLRLAGSLPVGRVAVAVAAEAPLVVPVNHTLDGDTVVFRSGPGTKLTALEQVPASFQIDFVDPFHRTGWSVLIRGTAHQVPAYEVEHLPVVPWAGGERDHWIRLVPTSITGRRIRLPDLPFDDRGYL